MYNLAMSKLPPKSVDAELRAQGCTSLKLRHMVRSVSRHYDAEIEKAGLKGTQYSLLSHVYRLAPVRPVDLAAEMKITASTLTRNLRPLMEAGWITLDAGVDARSRLVNLTPQGRDKREEAKRRWDAAQKSLNDLLGADRVLALHKLLNESLELMSATDADTEAEDDE